MSRQAGASRWCCHRGRTTLLGPITTRLKGYPFEVAVPADCGVTGVVLSDQVKSLDWRARRAEFICRLPAPIIADVLARLAALIT